MNTLKTSAPASATTSSATNTIRPNVLGGEPVAPSGGYVTFSPRVKLVTLSTVRSIRGTDAETVLKSADDATQPKHLRFVFNIGCSLNGAAREFRFWATEIAAPELVKNFTIAQAIGEILGSKMFFSRTEVEIAWTCASNQISRLIKAGLFSAQGSRLTRASLEAFLLGRWSGNNPT